MRAVSRRLVTLFHTSVPVFRVAVQVKLYGCLLSDTFKQRGVFYIYFSKFS